MNNQLTLLFLFFSIFILHSQGDRIIRKGKIQEFETPIPGVHIFNLSSLHGTFSNKEGEFELYIKANDTLKISHIKYHSLQIIVTGEFLKWPDWVIFIREKVNRLDAITLKKHDLTGLLNIDRETGGFKKIDQKHALIKEIGELAKLPSFKNYGRDLEKPPENNVDPIGKLSGGVSIEGSLRFKDLELRREFRVKRSFPDKIIYELGRDYFIKTLKIPEKQIHHFLTYCSNRNIRELYQKNEIIKILDILMEESIIYNKISR